MKRRKWFRNLLVLLLTVSMTVPANVCAAEPSGENVQEQGALSNSEEPSGEDIQKPDGSSDVSGEKVPVKGNETDTTDTNTEESTKVDGTVDSDKDKPVNPGDDNSGTEDTKKNNDTEDKKEDLDISDETANENDTKPVTIQMTGEASAMVSMYRTPAAGEAVAQVGEETYTSLQEAINQAEDGATIQLLKDIELTEAVWVKKSVIISGSKEGQSGKNGEGCYKISAPIGSGGRVFNLDASGNDTTAIAANSIVTFKDIQIEGPMTADGNTRGISIYQTSGLTVNLENAYVSASCYALNIASNNTDIKVNVDDSKLEGWCAFQLWSPANVTVRNSELVGTNEYTPDKLYSFATIVVNQNSVASTITVENSVVKAISHDSKDTPQEVLSIQNIKNDGVQNYPSGNQIIFTDCDIVAEGMYKLDDGTMVKLEPEYYAEGSNTLTIDGISYFIPAYGNNVEDMLDVLAMITRDGKKIAYGSLEAAIGDAQDGETVTLLKNTEISGRIDITKGITLDLGENTVTDSHSGAGIACNADSIVIKNGTIKAANKYAAIYMSGGDVTAEGLTIDTSECEGGVGHWGQTSGVYVSGGTFTLKADSSIKSNEVGIFVINEDSTVNVYGSVETISSVDGNGYAAISGNGSQGKGGTAINIYDGAIVKGASGTGMYLPQSGTTNIYGGTIEGYTGIGIKSGNLNITGGTIIGNGAYDDSAESVTNGIQFDGSAIMVDSYIGYAGAMNIKISGSAVLQSINAHAIHEIGNTNGATNIVTLDITGGTFTGGTNMAAVLVRDETADTVNISGGAFSTRVPNDYCAEGYDPTEGILVNGYYTVEIQDTAGAVAQVGNVKFKTVEEAVQAVQNGAGGTIQLLKDVTESVTIPAGATVTLDLNGNNLTAENNRNAITVLGALTLKDNTVNGKPAVSADYETVIYSSGKVSSDTKHAIAVYNGGELIMDSGTVESAGNCGIYVGATGTNTVFNGTATINGGYIKAREFGIGVIGQGSVLNINDGVIVADDNAAVGGNGTKTPYCGGTTMNIKGGTMISHIKTPGYIACGVYHPQEGTLNITGGTIYADGGVGVLMRGGELNMTGGEVIATGNVSGKVGDSNIVNNCYGVLLDGAAGYYGAVDSKVNISGNSIVLADSGIDALMLTDKGGVTGTIAVSGGSFSTKVPDGYCANGFVPTGVLVNGRYTVTKPAAAPSTNTGSSGSKKKHHSSSSSAPVSAAPAAVQNVASAKTGDDTNMWFPVLLLLLAMAGVGGYGYRTVSRRKRR